MLFFLKIPERGQSWANWCVMTHSTELVISFSPYQNTIAVPFPPLSHLIVVRHFHFLVLDIQPSC